MKHALDNMTGDLAGSAASAGNLRSQTGTGEGLRAVLAEVLAVETISIDDHFFNDLGADSMIMARFCARLRKRDDLPSVSMRDVYANPTIRSLAAAFAQVAPIASGSVPAVSGETPVESRSLESTLAEVLAEVLDIQQVEPDADFFQELGADSMVMARFCARLRKRSELPSISMKEVYANPTIRSLVASLAPAPAAADVTPAAKIETPASVEVAPPIATWRYVLCGVLQFGTGFAFLVLGADLIVRSFAWMLAGSDYGDIYLRSLALSTTFLFVAIVLPIFAKLLLIGSWTPRKIRIWSLDYYRFWLVKTLVQTNPLVLFPTPIYTIYLRLLGAKIGRNVLFIGHRVPVCTDLLTVGDDAVIRKDSYLNGYRANSGWIEIGSITIGKNAVVGEMTVLDIHTTLGDGAQIGHSSSLHAGQSIPAGEHWCGSPARQKTDVDYLPVPPAKCGLLRKTFYCVTTLLPGFVLTPVIIAVMIHVVIWLAGRPYFGGPDIAAHAHQEFYRDALMASTMLFLVGTIVGLVSVVTIPRLLNLFLRPGKTYPLYGFHYWVQGRIAGLTNIKFFLYLFGDSSYIVYYLRAIGYDLSKVVQTGSNFGMDLKHDNPFLVTIGSGTMVADGLSSINTEYSSSSFRSDRVTIGANNFVGNQVAYPSRGKTGDNCLLGTKVMVPLDGPIREDIGILGSPSFDIPRTVHRDGRIAKEVPGDELQRRLSRKNRHNLATMGLFLLVHWVQSALMLLLAFTAVDHFSVLGSLVIAVATMIAIPLRVGCFVFFDRASTLFRSLQPRTVSIYDPYFWFHERHWKLMATSSQVRPFDGTPLKGFIWKLLGIRIGRRLFDDGCGILERTLVTIGDDCTLNQGSIIQPHSQEDAGFKSDRIVIGSSCTLGVGSWVHYGVVMADGVLLAPNAFLMKGEQAPPYTLWAENPAREIGQIQAVTATRAAPVLEYLRALNAPTLTNGAQAR